METVFQTPSLQQIDINSRNEVFVLREDLIHSFISGNKWRKLKYNIEELHKEAKNQVVTFGGAYSNHLVATAAAGKLFGFQTIGIIRGEEIRNERIDFMRSCGMVLQFISRTEYRMKDQPAFHSELMQKLKSENILQDQNKVLILPEGGSNAAAVKGAKEIMDEVPDFITHIFCACGTGGTIAGMSLNLKPHQKILAVPVLKDGTFLKNEIERLGGKTEQIEFHTNYHFGGYAKSNAELNLFCKKFTEQTSIPIEPVYTGKVFYAVHDLLKKNYFQPADILLIVHSGGIFPSMEKAGEF